MSFCIALVLRARKFRAGSEVLLLGTVRDEVSLLREAVYRQQGGRVQSWPREASRQHSLLLEQRPVFQHSAYCGPQAGSEWKYRTKQKFCLDLPIFKEENVRVQMS